LVAPAYRFGRWLRHVIIERPYVKAACCDVQKRDHGEQDRLEYGALKTYIRCTKVQLPAT
jgi:hypothetical protein